MPEAGTWNVALYQRVHKLRIAAGLSQSQAAAALGLAKSSYIHFEKRSPLPASLIVPFADLVGVNVRYLLTGSHPGGAVRG